MGYQGFFPFSFFSEYVLIKLPWKFRFEEGQTKESFEALGPTRIGQTMHSLRIVFGSHVPSEQGMGWVSGGCQRGDYPCWDKL